MSQASQQENIDERISDEFRKRIRENIENSQNENFKSSILEHIPAVLIKINLERAVFEQALLFRNYIMKYLETEHKNFILDFSKTIFLDSTFLGSVIFFYKQVDSIGGTVRLVVNTERMTLLSQVNNFDDIIETFFMNICFKAEVATMLPVMKYIKFNQIVIRPLALVKEKDIIEFSNEKGFKSLVCKCPYGQQSKRIEVRKMIEDLAKNNVSVKENIFKSMSRINMEYLMADN